MQSKLFIALSSSVGSYSAALLLSGCSLIFSPELDNDAELGGACTTSADCSDDGATFVCQSGTCINALNANCASVTGNVQAPGTIVLGSILPTIGSAASIGIPLEQAQDLAVQEINNSGGLVGNRRLAIVKCDSSGSREQGLAVATHLSTVVGVPAILGPAFSSIFIDVTTQVTAPAGVLTISPSATSQTISSLEDDGLAWRTAASDEFQGGAIADLVQLRGFTRVIALGKNDAYGNGLLNRVSAELGDQLQDGFAPRAFPDPGVTPDPDYASVVTAALDQVPDPEVAIVLGTTEVADVVGLLETTLANSSTTGFATIRYILADGGKVDEIGDLIEADIASGSGTLIDRIEGTEPNHQNDPFFSAFGLRFQTAFGEGPGIFAANAYDAVYVLAYAASAIGAADPVTGDALATGMARLVTGREITAGPNEIGEARTQLSSGASINYTGASGPLDFNLDTGEAGTNVTRWVYETRPNDSVRSVSQGDYTIDSMGDGTWSIP